VGTVVGFNGSSTPIPIVGGTIPDVEGTGTLHVVATNPNGVTSTVDVPISIVVPAPTIVGPPDVTVTSCANASIGVATASNCLGPVPVSSNAPAKFPIGTTVVTWTATDTVGQTATFTQRVTAVLGDDASCCPSGTNVIVGTAGPDTITGTAVSDCILGLGGDDTIFGAGGNDFISGGSGNDTINAANGNSFIFGGPGNDTITAANFANGVQFINGGGGTDQCVAGPGTNIIINCSSATGCTNACCATSSCTEPTAPSAASCAQPYAKSSCPAYVTGTVVSAGGNNWECSNGNCAECAAVAGCAPGGSGCPWGAVWTNEGACH
jgi:Ca2+-binding RTX toxin-like protein